MLRIFRDDGTTKIHLDLAHGTSFLYIQSSNNQGDKKNHVLEPTIIHTHPSMGKSLT